MLTHLISETPELVESEPLHERSGRALLVAMLLARRAGIEQGADANFIIWKQLVGVKQFHQSSELETYCPHEFPGACMCGSKFSPDASVLVGSCKVCQFSFGHTRIQFIDRIAQYLNCHTSWVEWAYITSEAYL